MKNKLTLIILVLCASNLTYSQSNLKWSRTGDPALTNDWIGTTTNEPLLLKANNILGIKIKTNGELMFKSLDLNTTTGPDGFVLTDSQGRIFRMNFTGNSNQFLIGDGTWGTLPLSITSWSASTGLISTSSSLTVGGEIVAQDKLTVASDALFNGTIINTALAGIGERIVYADDKGNLKVGPIANNPLAPSPCIAGAGPWYEGGNFSPANNTIGTCSSTDFILKSNNVSSIWIKPDGKIGIGTLNPLVKFDINGSVKIQESSSSTSIPLDIIQGNGQDEGIKFLAQAAARTAFEVRQSGASSGNSRFITLGNGSTYIGQFSNVAFNYQSSDSYLTIGQPTKANKAFNVVDNTNINSPIDYFTVYGSGYTEIKANTPNGSDDVFAIKDANNSNNLNFKITKSGNVNIKVPNVTYISGGPAVALGVYQNDQTTGGTIGQVVETDFNVAGYQNTIFLVNRDDTKAFSVNKKTATGIVENFVTMGNGQTYIGGHTAVGNHSDALLSVYGKILARSIYVNTSSSVWSDYVFEKDYKLITLEEVESYYKRNKHLPGVPSAKEIEITGDNLVETDAILLKKIEELTLYIVQLQKEVNNLKKANTKN